MMKKRPTPYAMTPTVAAAAIAALVACGGSDDDEEVPTVTIGVAGPNVVSQWNEIAAATINQPAATSGTAEEQRPIYAVDRATVHIAMYDAAIAIAGTHKPFATAPGGSTSGASQEAAVATAAYRVLLGLFPARASTYQAAYDGYLATLPVGAAKDRGVADWVTSHYFQAR